VRNKNEELIEKVARLRRKLHDRVFHDRELCGYLTQLRVNIRFDGMGAHDTGPRQWMDRVNIPVWAKESVQSPDKGLGAVTNLLGLAEYANGNARAVDIEPDVEHGCLQSRGRSDRAPPGSTLPDRPRPPI
jgi:hypothetical protein